MLRRLLCGLAAAVLLTHAAWAIEVEATFDLGNLDFSRTRAETDTSLPGDVYIWGIHARARQPLAPQLALDFEWAADPILRNVVHARLEYTDRFFAVRFGPFFGAANSPGNILQSGLSTELEFYVPGVIVVSLRSDTSLSARLVVPGDYIQEMSAVSVGFYAQNALPTLYAENRRYTSRTAGGELVDSVTAYGLRSPIFQKNAPYRIELDFSYQAAAKTFVDPTPTTHAYGALVLGTAVEIDLPWRITLLAGMESSMYLFGREALLGSASADRFLFRMSTGARISID